MNVKSIKHAQFIENLKRTGLPAKEAFYHKIVSFLYYKKLTFDDVKWEVLKEMEVDIIKTQTEEMDWISKFNAEKMGFNGIFAKEFQIERSLQSADKAEMDFLEKLRKKQEEKNKEIKKDLLTIKEKDYKKRYMPWIAWQFGAQPFMNCPFEKLNIIYEEYCNNILKLI